MTLFSCNNCYKTVDLDEINQTREEAAREHGDDVVIRPIVADERVYCPDCDGGVMSAITDGPDAVTAIEEDSPAPVSGEGVVEPTADITDVPVEEKDKEASAVLVPNGGVADVSSEESVLDKLNLNMENLRRYTEFKG